MPVPKRPVISSLNGLRPVAHTSAVMKVCERVVLCKLDSLVKITLIRYNLPTGEIGVPMMLFYTS